jgi:hypothetical protein
MVTGKRRTSTGVGPLALIALVGAELELGRAAEQELDPAVAELERDPAVAEPELVQVAARELELVQVVALELELVQVAAEQELDPAVAELERDPAVAEPELVQVVALELELVQVAVALRTKSVTTAHRLDLVPLLEAGEDLAVAVAETTREPVAAEAVIAWEVAE